MTTTPLSILANAGTALRRALMAGVAAAMLVVAGGNALAASRIKDIIDFEGVRDNLLVGYGL